MPEKHPKADTKAEKKSPQKKADEQTAAKPKPQPHDVMMRLQTDKDEVHTWRAEARPEVDHGVWVPAGPGEHRFIPTSRIKELTARMISD